MDVPISLGVILACGDQPARDLGRRQHAYFDSAITLLFFLLIGRYLDRRARGRARPPAERCWRCRARSATVVAARRHADACAASTALVPGDMLLVAAGERIGVDGRRDRRQRSARHQP